MLNQIFYFKIVGSFLLLIKTLSFPLSVSLPNEAEIALAHRRAKPDDRTIVELTLKKHMEKTDGTACVGGTASIVTAQLK